MATVSPGSKFAGNLCFASERNSFGVSGGCVRLPGRWAYCITSSPKFNGLLRYLGAKPGAAGRALLQASGNRLAFRAFVRRVRADAGAR